MAQKDHIQQLHLSRHCSKETLPFFFFYPDQVSVFVMNSLPSSDCTMASPLLVKNGNCISVYAVMDPSSSRLEVLLQFSKLLHSIVPLALSSLTATTLFAYWCSESTLRQDLWETVVLWLILCLLCFF